VQTGKDYDVAVRGEGFFQITLPDGRTAYTRDGSFELDSQGRMVTAQGNVLSPGLTIPHNSTGVTINAQGQVQATIPGSTTPTVVGQIQLAMFVNKAGLQGMGDNLYLETPASGAPTGRQSEPGCVRQPAAGQPRAGECRGRERNLRPDRGAARLRDERQGHHGDRPDCCSRPRR